MVALHVCQVWWTLAYKPLRTRRHKSWRTLCQGGTVRACVHSVGMLCGYMPNSSYFWFSKFMSCVFSRLALWLFDLAAWNWKNELHLSCKGKCSHITRTSVRFRNWSMPWSWFLAGYYGRTLSNASMLYFADVFYFILFFLWPPQLAKRLNGSSRNFHTW